MGDGSQELWKDLSRVADGFADLGRQMLHASRRLHAPGVLPQDSLFEEVGRLRSELNEVRDAARRLAVGLRVAPPEAAVLESVKGVADFLEELTEVEARFQERAALAGRAAEVLGRVLRLRHTHQGSFAPLVACQNQARELLASFEADPAAADLDLLTGLADSDHPFGYLLAMVDGNDGVADDLWESLFESVEQSFGKTLAAAIARSRVVPGDADFATVRAEVPQATTASSPAVQEAPPTRQAAAVEQTSLPAEYFAAAESFPRADGLVVDAPGLASLADTPGAAVGVHPEGVEDLLHSVVSEAMTFLPRGLAALRPLRKVGRTWGKKKSTPSLERLESVALMTCNVISGYVFLDANNNGLFDPGETPIGGNTIELRSASSVVVGIAQTAPNGFYQFSTDSTVSAAPKTLTKTVDLASRRTNFNDAFTVPQFDPALGTLTSVGINLSGAVTSDIKAENLSHSSPATITATVSGELGLASGGVGLSATLSSPAGTFAASTYDGTLDFAGTRGTDFGPKSATGSKATTFSTQAGNDLSAFVGTGSVSGTFSGTATSTADGGGNLAVDSVSTASATVAVTYTYTPVNCLAPGNYTIVQPVEPPGTLNGKVSRDGAVLPPVPSGPDVIPVTLGTTDLVNNDFGELKPSSLAGSVYYDKNDDGVKDPSEPGIPGTMVALKGTDDLGHLVTQSTKTDGAGAYSFPGLRPGTYEIDETQPAGFLQGKNTIGTPGGSVGFDRFFGVVLPQGYEGVKNNFGELLPASINGYVYVDLNKNGLKGPGEPGLPSVPVVLTGVDDHGTAVKADATTDASGFYNFPGLRPGTYTATEPVQPAGYEDGQETKGNVTPIPNSIGTDAITGIAVAAGQTAPDNNFGETTRDGTLSGFVYVDLNKDGLKEPNEPGIPNVAVALNGKSDQGVAVAKLTSTDAQGFYSFTGLRPGIYSTSEPTQPKGYADGQETRGNVVPLPHSIGTDVIPDIPVKAGQVTPNNNFGELKIVVPPPNAKPVEVIKVTRLGIHHQLHQYVIQFSGPLNKASAENLAHYRIVVAHRDGTLGTHPIPLKSAVYDPATDSVTLTPVHRMNIHYHYQLTITGVLDAEGDPIAGNGGVVGAPYTTIVTKANFPDQRALYTPHVPSGPSAHVLKAAGWAHRFPRLAEARQRKAPTA